MPVPSMEKTTREHISAVLNDIRQADVDELWAAAMTTPEKEMIRHIDGATTGLVDGVPVCVFGVTHTNDISGVAIPWLITTNRLEKHARLFLAHCRGVVMGMRSGCRLLVNYVDARNTRAIKWLRWLGFTLDAEPIAFGVQGFPFYRFTMEGLAVDEWQERSAEAFMGALVESPYPFSVKVGAMTKFMSKLPVQADLTPVNRWCDGLYCRELFMPKGTLYITKVHLKDNIAIISKGDVSVLTEETVERFQAPRTMITRPGTQRIIYTHEDTVWTTVHPDCGTTEQDGPEMIESLLACDTMQEYWELQP